MFLIGDGGSTYTGWAVLGEDKNQVARFRTGSFNPYFCDRGDMIDLFESEMGRWRNQIRAVRYYGAGCTPDKRGLVGEALASFFSTDDVEVDSDLMAAVLALGKGGECLVGILGTGSNSCYYDGETISRQVSPLGYILGDEGSGAVLGRKLLGNVLKGLLPEGIAADFYREYETDRYEIINKVYRGDFPNRFMAGFVPFIKKHIDKEPMRAMVGVSFGEFIERNLLQYDLIKALPVHFAGSIAWHFKEELAAAFDNYRLLLGTVVADPMEGLLQYYMNK